MQQLLELNAGITLTPHQAFCYFENYPANAKWYIENNKSLDVDSASKSYNGSVKFMHENPSITCNLHPLVMGATLADVANESVYYPALN